MGVYTGAALRHFRRGGTELGEGGAPAVAPLFVLEAQLMPAGRPRGRPCREEARRHCRLSSCGLHPGKLPVGGRRDGRLRERAAGWSGHSSGIPGLLISPRRALPGRESGETRGPEEVPESRLQEAAGHRKEPSGPGPDGCATLSASSDSVGFAGPDAQTVLVSLVPPRVACPTPQASQPRFPESAWLLLGSRFSSSSRESVKAMSLFFIILHCRRTWFVSCSVFLIISSFFVTPRTLNSLPGCCCFRRIQVRAF